MQPDAAAKVRRDNDASDREAKRKAEQAAEEHRVAVSKMSPTEREIAEFLDARTDRNTAEIPALINALKSGRWSGETKVAVRAGHLTFTDAASQEVAREDRKEESAQGLQPPPGHAASAEVAEGGVSAVAQAGCHRVVREAAAAAVAAAAEMLPGAGGPTAVAHCTCRTAQASRGVAIRKPRPPCASISPLSPVTNRSAPAPSQR